MEFESPKDYKRHELKIAPSVRVSNTFKLQIPMDQTLRDYARANRTGLSVVIRHAMHEYLEKRGLNAFQPLGVN